MSQSSPSPMTPDDLEAAVLAGEPEHVLELLRGATEAERRKAHARAASLRTSHGDWQSLIPGRAPLERGRNEASLIALCGTGSAAEIRAGRRMWRTVRAIEALRLRPTELLVELTPWMLEHLGWTPVRRLVRDGLLPRPDLDAYVSGMLDFTIDPQALLRDDAELFDHEVWRLFEVEGTADRSLSDHDKYKGAGASWSALLVELAAGNAATRARLLDASLSALERDFPAFRAGWYSRFHEALAPTVEERRARLASYLRLLRSPIPATVAMAVRGLSELQRAGMLEGGVLLDAISPVLNARAAATSRTALRLVDVATRESAALHRRGALVAAEALAHQSVDIQAAALRLLERLLARDDAVLDAVLDAAVTARQPDVAPSLQPALAALLGRGAAEAGAATSVRAVAEVRAAAGLTLPGDPFAALRPIEPIRTLPELVESIAHVLETEGPPIEIERILDGISRLSPERPPNFERLVGAVRQRAAAIQARRSDAEKARWGGYADAGIATNVAALVVAWVDGIEPAIASPWPVTVGRYLVGRFAEIAQRAVARTGQPMLALPTHDGGWIEPMVLVDRLAGHLSSSTDPAGRRLDLVQAMLRLLPARRAQAIELARSLAGEEAAAVRFALGDDVEIGPTRALWVAAARSRDPDGDVEAVERAHPGIGAGGGTAGCFSLAVLPGHGGIAWPGLVVEPPLRDPSFELPTQLLATLAAQRYVLKEHRALVAWMALVWPQSRRSWFAASAALMLRNLDWWEAEWANRARLDPLFEPWMPAGREAGLLLAVALQAKEPGERGSAVEATAELLRTGRLTGRSLADALCDLGRATAEWESTRGMRPGRLAASLDQVVRMTPELAAAVQEILARGLEAFVPSEGPLVRVGHLAPLLRSLVELAVLAGRPTPDEGLASLERIARGSGETAKLARGLLGP